MPFDSDRVRIELCDIMRLDGTSMTASQAAEIWLAASPGTSSREPDATITTTGTRAALLRVLADWIEQKDDPGLIKLVAATQSAARPDPAPHRPPASRM